MTADEGTGIDLTNCISYFDGCNTCTVVSGQVAACTKMYCETPTEPQCLLYEWTGMDLSGCISYFDGCNTCSVKDGRPDACTMMYCETPSEPKCNAYAMGTVEITWALDNTGINGDIIQSYTTKKYNNTWYWLSFSYPAARKLETQESANNENCSLNLTITITDPSKPLQCFDAWCVPDTQPSLWVYIWNNQNCQWMHTTCSELETNLQTTCHQLISMGMSEAKAASTISFWGNNGTDYTIIQGMYANILRWTFIVWIVTQYRAFLLKDSWYAVQIFDNQWMYTDVFDDFIKTFNYN